MMKESSKDFDTLLSYHIGEFGRYQKFVFFTLSVVAMGVAWQNLLHVFTGSEVPHSCISGKRPALNHDLQKYSLNESLSYFDLIMKDKFQNNYSLTMENESCNYVVMANGTFEYDKGKATQNETARVSLSCERWTYGTSQWTYGTSQCTASVVCEWDLVCERAWLSPLAQSLHFIGCLVGSMLFGHLSDRFGRRKILLVTTLLEVVIGIITAFSPRYEIYAFLRFLVGMAIAGQFTCAYTIITEIVGPKWRSLASVGMMYFNSFGFMILAVTAYFIRDWRILQLALSAPLILLLTYYLVIPESPRWLITHGKFEEASGLMRKMARWNRTNIPDDLSSCLGLHEKPKFAVSVSYFGLSMNTSHLDGNDYLNFFLSGLVELPAYTFCMWSLNRLGRKITVLSAMLLAGITLLITGTLPSSLRMTRIGLCMLGKFGISISFASIYPLSVELFPTVVRNSGLGICAVAARVGSFVAPYVVLNMGDLESVLPFIIFGAISFTGGVLCVFLPETRGQHLPDSLEDAEKINTIYGHCICLRGIKRGQNINRQIPYDTATARKEMVTHILLADDTIQIS